MDDAQAAKWTADQEAAAAKETASTASEPSTQFFTGKPYVADAGGYIYKYRTYNPEMSRWTSADPSGFPDGPNNKVYAPVPTIQIDQTGLMTESGSSNNVEGELGPSLLGGAGFYGTVASGNAYGSTGVVSLFGTISGSSWALGSISTADADVTITIVVGSDGNLQYSTSGSYSQTNEAVSSALNISVTGDDTKTIGFHVTVGFALFATTINGAGAGADSGSISFGSTSYQTVQSLGDFYFTE
jgi:RHS repeat-associated protein